MKLKYVVMPLAVVSLFCVGTVRADESDMTTVRGTVSFQGLNGTSKDKLPTEVAITALSQNINANRTRDKITDPVKISYTNTITVTKMVDATSPLLMKAMEADQKIKVVTIRTSGPGWEIDYTLRDAFISSMAPSLTLDPSNTNNQETVDFRAAKMDVVVTKGHTHSETQLTRASDDN